MSPPRSRFVFVAGLHRTGTSLLARIIAAHPAVSAIENAPVPENEGCYLQGAIPHTALDGRPGHYATDPLQHHTEQSPWNTLETQRRLLSDWGGWFDPDKPWWLEKSPINLTRMRLYQQLFPTAQFIVILRHPQLMAAALGKWVTDEPAALLRYGIDAYDTVAQDLPILHASLVLRYEDLVSRPDAVRRAVFAFLSLEDNDPQIELRDGNRDYRVGQPAEEDAVRRMARWGYAPGGEVHDFAPRIAHPLRSVRDAVSAALEQELQSEQKEQKANIRQ
jgi:hypothetical protein